MRPLSMLERKSVWALILLTSTTPSASEAILSMYTGTPRSVSPSSTTSIEERIGAPQSSSVTPRDSRISTCPSAVAPPWLPIEGTINGSAPISFKIATRERRIPSISAMPRLPAVSATLIPGLMAEAISSRPNCSRSAASTLSTRGLGNLCLILTTFGNSTSNSSLPAPRPGQCGPGRGRRGGSPGRPSPSPQCRRPCRDPRSS